MQVRNRLGERLPRDGHCDQCSPDETKGCAVREHQRCARPRCHGSSVGRSGLRGSSPGLSYGLQPPHEFEFMKQAPSNVLF